MSRHRHALGMYVLRSAVTNPKPNRAHKHDWTKDETWPAGGKYFMSERRYREGYAPIQVICRLGQFSSLSLSVESEQGKALLSGLERVEPSTVEDVTRISEASSRNIRATDILQHLVDSGVISLHVVKRVEDILFHRDQNGPDQGTLANALSRACVVLDPTGTFVVCGSLPAGVALSGGGWHAHEASTGRTARYDGDLGSWSDLA